MKAGNAASEPRGKAESREVRRATEGSQQCKRSIQQRVLEARNRDPIAAGDGEHGRQKLSASGRAEDSPEATMKHPRSE